MVKNIVISGITKGIGEAIAFKFLEKSQEACHIFGFAKTAKNTININYKPLFGAGFKVAYNPHWINQKDISTKNHHLYIDSVNAQNRDEIKQFAEKLSKCYEQTHILVNNVGIYRTGSLFTEPDAQWEELFKVNLDAAYYLTKYLYSTFGKGTHIFNICSVASKEIVKDAPSYSVSKMAFYGLHKAMAQELEPLGIKVTAILPGAVYTDSWKDAAPSIRQVILSPDEIANLVWDTYNLSSRGVVKEIEIKPMNF